MVFLSVEDNTRVEFALALAQMLLQGYICAQLLEYAWTASRGDRWLGLRLYTALVAVACAAQTVLEVYKAWHYMANVSEWIHNPMRGVEIICNVVVCSLVQVFFIARCWKATRSFVVVVYLSVLLLATLALNIYVIVAIRSKYTSTFYTSVVPTAAAVRELKIIVPFYVFTPTLLDASITVLLIAFFKRSQTGLAPLDAVLRRTAYLAFEAAALPTAARLAAGIGFLTHSWSTLTFCAIVTGKLYVIAYMRALNVRPGLRRQARAVRGRHSLSESGTSASVEFTAPSSRDGQWDAAPWTQPEPIAPHERADDPEAGLTFLEALQSVAPAHHGRRRSSETTCVGSMDGEAHVPLKHLEDIGEGVAQ